MGFTTKLDFSSNRQVKQHVETFTSLSGGTQFGVPFSSLRTGVNVETSGITEEYVSLTSSYSGNSGVTIYNWADSRMELGASSLSALTPSTSGYSQEVFGVYTPNETTIIDGNNIVLSYSGVEFDLYPQTMVDLGSGNYSGTVFSFEFLIYSAASFDFTGRTIWNDVSGITRTQDLIITRTPAIGQVWTCIDTEGKGAWGPVSGAVATNSYFTSGSSGSYSIKAINNSGLDATGNYSFASGYNTLASGLNSFVHGSGSTASGINTIVLGANITGSSNNYVYVPSLNIKTIASSPFSNDIRIDASGNLTTNTSDIFFKENIKEIDNALETILKLRGVTYQWKDKVAGGDAVKFGFIAQEVASVNPLLAFTNPVDGYMGIHNDSFIPLIIESIKEICDKKLYNKEISTQSIFAEDNDIQLNFNGNSETAKNGGIKVLHGIKQDESANLLIDKDGNWFTNNDFKSKYLTIPKNTPISSEDVSGNIGNITYDDNYLYIKTSDNKWKRTKLEEF